MSWKFLSLLGVASFLILGCNPVLLADSSDVLAEIGDIKITEADLQAKLDELPSYARRNFETTEGKIKLLQRLVRTELLLKAAEEAGYEKRPEIQKKLEDARKRILTSEYFKNEMSQKPPVDEAQIKSYYNSHLEEFAVPASVEARHILLENQEDAQNLRKRLINKELSFEDAVKQFSKDYETKDSGGKLGLIRKGSFIKGIGRSSKFDDAIFSLKPGDISTPLQSRRGWHLIQVTERHEAGYKPLEEVKDIIADELLVSEEDIEKEYNAHPEKYMTRPRCKIRHIQLQTEEEAKKVYEQLKKGADFSELVKEKSTDVASVRQNGNLGYLYKDGYIRGIGKDPEFEKAVFALKEGEFSQPIHSKKGWHIVLVEEKIDARQKPLSEVHDQIKKKLIRDAKENALDNRFKELEKKFNCKIYTDHLKNN